MYSDVRHKAVQDWLVLTFMHETGHANMVATLYAATNQKAQELTVDMLVQVVSHIQYNFKNGGQYRSWSYHGLNSDTFQ